MQRRTVLKLAVSGFFALTAAPAGARKNAGGLIGVPPAPRSPGEALLEAARRGARDDVEALLNRGVRVDHRDGMGATALIRAANWPEPSFHFVFGPLPDPTGHRETLRLLLERGARVDAADKRGLTALMAAAAGGREAIVRELLAAGADVHRRDCADGQRSRGQQRGVVSMAWTRN